MAFIHSTQFQTEQVQLLLGMSRNLLSAIRNRSSAIKLFRIPHSAFRIWNIPHSAFRIAHSAFGTFRIPRSEHSAFRIQHSAFETFRTPHSNRPLLISIVGPTGSGKSALALAIAERLQGEIVNCDSLQIYRDLNVGVGKPALEDLVRVPHHLMGFLPLSEIFSAGDMQKCGRGAVETIVNKRVPAIVVGGTGFYVRALFYGLPPAPKRVPELRERLHAIVARRGDAYLFRMLQRVDPVSAKRIMRRDRVRIIRALEVYFAGGVPLSEFRVGDDCWVRQFQWIALGLNPDRQLLYNKINGRVEWMLRHGWLEEVRNLLDAGADPKCKAFEAIGYREIISHLQGELTFEELLEQVQRRTRQYAKRQLTWFRKEPGIFWLHGFGDDERVVGEALERIDAR